MAVAQSTENETPAVHGEPPQRKAAKTLPEGTRVGLLAGYGRFPFLFQDFALARGLKIVTVGGPEWRMVTEVEFYAAVSSTAPEPSTLVLSALGLIGLCARRRPRIRS
jgi:hypothetical protein